MGSDVDFEAADGLPEVSQLCRYLTERSPQPMAAVDGATHVVTYVNPAFEKLVGRQKVELVGRHFAEAVPEGAENECLKVLDRVYQTGHAENLPEQEHRQLGQRPVFWSYAMWAILGADETPKGVMIQITDATETALFRQQSVAINESLLISATKQHEISQVAEALSAKLKAAVKMRDRFIAVMSHELRNPLATLSTGIELLKLSEGDAITAERARDMMERQLKQMVRLVNDLLDVSRITTGKLELHKERIQLASVLDEAVEASRTLIDQNDHQLEITLPTEPVLLDADRTRLIQVFSNLLNNAAKYSERGGLIRLSVKLDQDEVVVSVQDTGIGIPAWAVPHIFETFLQVDTSWQRSQGGMGIGLSLVKEFVALHGGRVEARSDGLGKGSEFIVCLPIAIGTGEEPTEVGEHQSNLRANILVVDDNKDAAATLAMTLKYLGHEVHVAHGGEGAVVSARTHRPALVLMDLGMPNVDGFEACRRIRAESWGRDLFLVALTGWGSDEDQRRTQKVGFNRHLIKPVDVGVLVKLIAEVASNKA